jgi:hypothetical protein
MGALRLNRGSVSRLLEALFETAASWPDATQSLREERGPGPHYQASDESRGVQMTLRGFAPHPPSV